MKDYKKYINKIKKLNCKDEKLIAQILKKEGLYSKKEVFPLACLQFELTAHCNAMCRHCYNNSGITNDIPDKLSPEKWIKFAKYLVDQGGIFECILSGGEPLLLKDKLFELMDILYDDGTIFMLITNGYLLTDEIACKLKKYQYHWLQISIDGDTAEYHDAFRQQEGSWKRAVKGAEYVSKYDIPLKIAHCVTPYNIDKIDEMCKLAFALGAKAITIGELCLSGRVKQNQNLLLSESLRKKMFYSIEENKAKYEGKMIVKSSNSVKEGLIQHKKHPAYGAVIRPNGDIRIDGMAPFVIGNVLEDDFKDIWTKKIKLSWENDLVQNYIDNFEMDDRNYKYVNYVGKDIKI